MKSGNKNIILQKLSDLNKRITLFKSITALSISLVIVFSVLLLITTIESFEYLSSTIRTIIYFGFIFCIIFVIMFLIVNYVLLLRRNSNNHLAQIVGDHFPLIKDRLKNALQLISEKNNNFSQELINKSYENIFNSTEQTDFNVAANKFINKRKIIILFASSLLVCTTIIIVPSLNSALTRVIDHSTEYSKPQSFTFIVNPGNTKVNKGSNITISIFTDGEEKPNSIVLNVKKHGESEFSNIELKRDSTDQFNYNIKNINYPVEYFVAKDEIKSDQFLISTINNPVITSLTTIVSPPYYTRLKSFTQADNADITALKGSSVKITLSSSKEIENANIFFLDSNKLQMDTYHDSAQITFSVYKENQFYFTIVDTEDVSNINPVIYSIKLLEDKAPSLNLIAPTTDVQLTIDDNISIISKISDDYGFSNYNLMYRLDRVEAENNDSTFSSVKVPISKRKLEQDIYFNWKMTEFNLLPGDVMLFYLEVFDNDFISGPKSERSNVIRIFVPSLDELFNQTDLAQENMTSNLEQTLEEAEKLKEDLKELGNELKQDKKEIEWNEKEKIENSLEKFKELSEKIKDVQKELKDVQNKLEENNLLSEETMKKYMELQDLMDELDSEELRKSLEKMQNMLEKMNRNNVQNELDNLSKQEEAFKKSIERTLSLLKRLQVEQKLDELIKRTEEIEKKQNEIMEEQNSSSQKDLDKQAKKQDEINKNLENLNKEMEDLQDKMSDMKDMPKEDLQKLKEEFEKQKNQELSDQAKSEIKKNNTSKAQESQSQLMGNMKKTKEGLQSMQMQMQQKNQMEAISKMYNSINDILQLSKDEEKLHQNKSNSSEANNKQAKEQEKVNDDLNKVLNNLSAFSKKSFMITPEMGKALGKANANMHSAKAQLQMNNNQASKGYQKQAMQNLNEAVVLMKDAMQQMMSQGGGKGGMMSMMQQLEKMGEQQMQLNQMTKMMKNGQLSQQQMAQMQRLAQQQKQIQKSLAQLNQEAKASGESKRLASNLERILNDMKEVITNLETEKLNDDLIQQQEKILSKLLDAQRSINERDFEERRKSIAGKLFNRNSPPELLFNTEEGKDVLTDELLKALKEGYLKDYEELIKKYYEALKSKTNTN